jgi:hypothetical protein
MNVANFLFSCAQLCLVHHTFTSSTAFSSLLLHRTPSSQVFFFICSAALLPLLAGAWLREGLPLLRLPGKVLHHGIEWFFMKYFSIM